MWVHSSLATLSFSFFAFSPFIYFPAHSFSYFKINSTYILYNKDQSFAMMWRQATITMALATATGHARNSEVVVVVVVMVVVVVVVVFCCW